MTAGKYERGDYVRVEFPDETTGIGEWMWVRVESWDDEKRLVFGTLDNEPVSDYSGKAELGSQLAVSYDNVREHKTPSQFHAGRRTQAMSRIVSKHLTSPCRKSRISTANNHICAPVAARPKNLKSKRSWGKTRKALSQAKARA